ncbi:MAG: hypothetical protein HY963_11250 [Ignavibacteriales bacterium]|nr:hypothetical protein [Ignavibacteriales bacterium]
MNDVDQKKVTSNAIKTDAVLESGLEKIFASCYAVNKSPSQPFPKGRDFLKPGRGI